ncbi:hypothetical protein T492DRAFT_1028768 [Pavlovales sp. CCMP2436]|nr:hypothetical protein T492DRAFT_1028768 [Pavlovales sp. CCMP2436]
MPPLSRALRVPRALRALLAAAVALSLPRAAQGFAAGVAGAGASSGAGRASQRGEQQGGARRVAMLASRRGATVALLGVTIALGGDLLGVTQAVLSLAPEAARDLRFDVLYPVGGYKRYYAPDRAYEFIYPKSWLADQALSLPKPGSVGDPNSVFVPRAVEARRGGAQLDSAFGPPGGDRTENVSVLRTRLGRGINFAGVLGEPSAAAQRLLDSSIAPAGSGKTATLNAAALRADGVLQFEYTVSFAEGTQMAGFVIRNQACVAYDVRTGELFTLTVLAPLSEWLADSGVAQRAIASSFALQRGQ